MEYDGEGCIRGNECKLCPRADSEEWNLMERDVLGEMNVSCVHVLIVSEECSGGEGNEKNWNGEERNGGKY